MAGHEWEDWFEREEFIGQISDIRVQNLQVEREVVQKRTFTRWMNLHLEKCNPPIEVHDLFRDIQDGHILMALLEELSGCKLLTSFKKSSHRIFRLNNIAKVLSFLEDRNVKLVSIDAADVADGNSSIILGLVWNIILFFQIKELTVNIRSQFPSSSSLSSIPTSSDSDVSYCSTPSDERQPACTAMREHGKAIKKLLQWVQKRTRKYGVAVQDFGKSWTSGVAFLAVIKSIDPSLVDMGKALLRSPRENLEDAFRIAHYSLGIPCLLEPEDVNNNAPDEQCIITYVSQFLKHFPGLEELEEPSHCMERSVSVGLLHLRDSDYHIRNSAQQSRVKERSYMFLRDYAQPPPKVLISSVSEDRSSTSPMSRPATTRSWSNEDFLADSPHMDDISSSVVKDPREAIDESLNSLEANFSQLSFTYSALESVTSDSAINSPDSWVESEFGVMPDTFYENKNDSLFCDQGKAWDVYHATPVEVTTLDEGFVPSLEDKAPDHQSITESHIDEGIYSLSSLESNQEPNQSDTDKRHVEEVKEKRVNPENYNQYKAQEQEPDQKKTDITKEVDSKLMDTSQTDEMPREQQILTNSGTEDLKTGENNHSQLISKNELPPHEHSEDNLKHSLEKSTEGEAKCLENLTKDVEDNEGKKYSQNNPEDAQVENECQSVDPLLEDKRRDVLKETKEQVVETLENVNERVLSDSSDYQRRICKGTSDAFANICSTNQEVASSTNVETSRNINICMISSGPEKQSKERICDPDKQAGEEEVQQTEVTLSNAADTDVSSPQKQEDPSCDFIDQHDKNLIMGNPCMISEHLKPTDCGQKQDVKKGQLEHTDKHDNINCSTLAMCVHTTDNMETYEAKKECEFSHDCTLTCNPDKNITAHISIENTTQQKKPDDTFSQNERIETTSELNGKTETLYFEATTVSSNMDFFYACFDQSTPTEDIVGDPIEPMDLFYPDKEEPMFTDPQDTDMKSWPSVLSVSALEPAPAAKALADDNRLNLLDNDWWNRVDYTKVLTNQVLVKAPESKEQCLLYGENLGGLWGSDVPGDDCSVNESEQPSPGSASENTEPVRSKPVDFFFSTYSRRDKSQTSSVLLHRKGAWFTEHMDCPSTVIAVTKKANSSDSDFRCSENRELYLLLLLWLMLYSFWMLPQMDLKTLPNVLLNLNP